MDRWSKKAKSCPRNFWTTPKYVRNTQVPGGQISPSEKYKNLSHPKLLQILFAMGILMKSQERNWGVPVAIWELWPCQYWPDRGSPDTHLTGINHQNKPWDDLGMPIHSQFVNIFHQQTT